MSEKPRKHRFRFGLRTMLLLVALLSAGLGWAFHIKQTVIEPRREVLAKSQWRKACPIQFTPWPDHSHTPWRLLIFGEQGIQLIHGESHFGPWTTELDAEWKALSELFPEATCSVVVWDQSTVKPNSNIPPEMSCYKYSKGKLVRSYITDRHGAWKQAVNPNFER